jgi:hypothetical protein
MAEPARRWEVSAGSGNCARISADVEPLGAPERSAVLALCGALEDPARGAPALWAIAEGDPAFPFGVSVAALGAALLGDQAHLDRYRAVGLTSNQFGTLYGRVPRTNTDHAAGRLYANETTTFYGVFTYGRRMPQDAVVPWLATIVWE